MEPIHLAATAEDPQQVVAKIEQRALRLSALLREIDEPSEIELAGNFRGQLDDVLELLACRITATRALLGHRSPRLTASETLA